MPPEQTVFISHSSRDAEAANLVCRALEQNGIRCWIAPRDIPGGDSWDDAIIKGIDNSCAMVLIFSSHANESPHVKKEVHRAFSTKKMVIPLRVENVEFAGALEYIMIGVHWLDALEPPLDNHLDPLIDRVTEIVKASGERESPAPGQAPVPKPVSRPQLSEFSAASPAPAQVPTRPVASASVKKASATAKQDNSEEGVRRAEKPLRVALLYRRNVQPDDHVVSLVESGLRAAGHEVFIDRHMRIGEEWGKEIERKIKDSDAVVPIISAASLQSEMLEGELKIASEWAVEQFGKPRILPVRVNFEDALQEPFHSILGGLQYHLWRDPSDDAELLRHLLDSLEAKSSPR